MARMLLVLAYYNWHANYKMQEEYLAQNYHIKLDDL